MVFRLSVIGQVSSFNSGLATALNPIERGTKIFKHDGEAAVQRGTTAD
jgi:hypothetical protein